MNKLVILTMLMPLTLAPAFATDNLIARSDAGRIINRIFNDNQGNNNYRRFDNNSNNNYRSYNRDDRRHQDNGRYNNNRGQNRYSHYGR